MASNYGYGYGQSSLYANYGYGGGVGGGASGQQVMPPAPPVASASVGYGGSVNQGYGYNYYQQQQAANAQYAAGTAQSYATPTTSSNPTPSVMYPTDYYQYSRVGSYSYQPQTTAAPATVSTSYSQAHTSYSQTGSFQSQTYTSYSQTGTGSYQPQTYTSYSRTGTGSYQPQTYTSYSQTGTGSYQPQTYASYSQTGTGSYQPQTLTSYSQTGSVSSYGGYSMATSTPPTSGSFSSMTPQQQKIIQDYATARERGGGGGKVKTQAEKNFLKKKTYDSEQNYYCEVCKVGCGSALTYKTHLEGKNHKRRLQLQQKATSAVPGANDPSLKCDVCDVFCSSKDSYLAHVRGSKHLKTVALFRRLGKPLPPMTSVKTQDDGGVQVTGPRITFVGGKKLSSTGLTLEPKPKGMQVYPPGAPEPDVPPNVNETSPVVNSSNSNVEPVGLDLVKPVKNHPKSPLSSYHCELCDCFFNDELARISHCKGRRHRINYKDAYDPTLKVEKYKASTLKKKQKDRMVQDKKRIASGNFGRGGGRGGGGGGGGGGRTWGGRGWGGRGGNTNKAEELFRLRQQEASAIAALHYGVKEKDYYHHTSDPYEDFHDYHHFSEPYPNNEDWSPDRRSFQMRNPADDKMVSTKYGQLYPSDSEIKAIQKAVLDIEAALKSSSDDLLMETSKRAAKEKDSTLTNLSAVKKNEALREIKGVMRVGLHAYDLLLRGQMEIRLVVICANVPTKDLLVDIHDSLPTKLVATEEATYHVSADFKKGELMIISNTGDVTVTVLINLTSYTIEGSSASQFTGQELNPSLCLSSLLALRQTNWFQANCQGMPSFSVAMRIFLDLKRRKAAFSVMSDWVLLLLIHKCITSAPPDYLRPGDIFRRVIECIASGVFLPGYPGLHDPCGDVDAAASMTAQERADLTLSAQHFLRLIAFNQLHIVLDMSPPPNYAPYSLKISPNNSVDPEEEEEEGEGGEWSNNGEVEVKRMKLDHI